MKKLVFKGVINGKEFDNVQDYNAEMNRLLSGGETNISASSNTRMVDEPTDELKEKPKENVKLDKSFDIQDYLPFFNDSTNNHYLDTLVSDSGSLNNQTLTLMKNQLKKNLDSLKENLEDGGVSVADAIEFINLLKDIRSTISEDSTNNDDVIDELRKRINRDTKDLNVLTSAKPFIDELLKYYNEAFNITRGYILSL